MDMASKIKKTAFFRLVFYLFVVLFFALLPVSVAESGSLCVFYRAFGLLCPACGTTRGNDESLSFSVCTGIFL